MFNVSFDILQEIVNGAVIVAFDSKVPKYLLTYNNVIYLSHH